MKRIILLLSLLLMHIGLCAATTASVDQSTLRCVQLIKPETQKTLQLVCNIQDGVQRLMYCIPIAITGNTTIDTPGIYCVANTSVPAITIEVSDVLVDLNGYSSSGILIYGSQTLNNITVKNGLIEGDGTDNGLLAIDARNVTIQDVTARNGQKGFYFNGVSNSRIIDSAVEGNTIGVMFTDSHKNSIDNVIASSNLSAGFSLISSATNCFKECKAVNTGEGNTQILNNEVFGFVSQDGHNNIFERCIANATQAYSTTDSQSVVAGFALRGDEKCTKIIDSESANATTNANGVTVPYGILLEAQFDGLVSVTSLNPDEGAIYDAVASLAWSPDGKYLAIGGSIYGNTDDDLIVYQFDRVSGSLNKITSLNPSEDGGDSILALAWSPDGNFLAVGGTINGGASYSVLIYQFDKVLGLLHEVTSVNPGPGSFIALVLELAWSPDGNYLAVGGFIFPGDDLLIYQFDRASGLLNKVTSVNSSGFSDTVTAIEWSPDGKYLAVGGIINGIAGLFVYQFDRGSGSLYLITFTNPDGGASDTVNAVGWSPDGKYLAVGGIINGTTGNDLIVYQFNRASGFLNEITSVNSGGSVSDVSWSADGNYLAVTAVDLIVYQFDRGSGFLSEIVSINPDDGTTDTLYSMAWAPDSAYLAVGGFNDVTGNALWMYTALTFPSKNVITNNTVYCNSGGSCPSGVGISGSSIQNMIIGNTAYSNPIPQSANHPIVESNYYFVTNVFNQLFGNAPSDLQNIALGGCEPICMPEDLGLLIKQNQSLILANCSKLDVIISIVSAL